MNKKIEIETYVHEKLEVEVDESFIAHSIILVTENDVGNVCDILVLINNEEYGNFVDCYNSNFVINDHDHEYPIFTKFRSVKWLEKDIKSRLPIALWIYQNSLVIQDTQGEFAKLLNRYTSVFEKSLHSLIKRKYIEMRTERHNLRQAVSNNRDVAIPIIKATIAKLILEISLLADGKPYPYKKWLPEIAKNSNLGNVVYPYIKTFLDEKGGEKSIAISEEIIAVIRDPLSKNLLPCDLLDRWWLYLE